MKNKRGVGNYTEAFSKLWITRRKVAEIRMYLTKAKKVQGFRVQYIKLIGEVKEQRLWADNSHPAFQNITITVAYFEF